MESIMKGIFRCHYEKITVSNFDAWLQEKKKTWTKKYIRINVKSK